MQTTDPDSDRRAKLSDLTQIEKKNANVLIQSALLVY